MKTHVVRNRLAGSFAIFATIGLCCPAAAEEAAPAPPGMEYHLTDRAEWTFGNSYRFEVAGGRVSVSTRDGATRLSAALSDVYLDGTQIQSDGSAVNLRCATGQCVVEQGKFGEKHYDSLQLAFDSPEDWRRVVLVGKSEHVATAAPASRVSRSDPPKQAKVAVAHVATAPSMPVPMSMEPMNRTVQVVKRGYAYATPSDQMSGIALMSSGAEVRVSGHVPGTRWYMVFRDSINQGSTEVGYVKGDVLGLVP